MLFYNDDMSTPVSELREADDQLQAFAQSMESSDISTPLHISYPTLDIRYLHLVW
jgi:hypothetical protein